VAGRRRGKDDRKANILAPLLYRLLLFRRFEEGSKCRPLLDQLCVRMDWRQVVKWVMVLLYSVVVFVAPVTPNVYTGLKYSNIM
jgi:hypothetical protein